MDPLSVSRGVAGLVSLGLTVCKGLNTFCQDYRSRDIDIINLKNHAQRLDSFLQLVQTRLQASHQVDSALSASLKNCFGACQGCILEFENLAKKQTRPPGPKRLKEYGKDATRHLQYPFQKTKFERLKAKMQEFYTAMTNYLLLLNHDLTNGLREAAVSESVKLVSLIMSENQKTATQIAALLPALERVVDAKLDGLEHSLIVTSRPSLVAENISTSSSSYPPKEDEKSLRTISPSASENGSATASCFTDSLAQATSRIKAECKPPEALPSTEVLEDELFQNFGCSCRAGSLFGRRDLPIHCRPKHDSHYELFFMNPKQRTIKGTLQLFSTLFSWKLEIRYSQQTVYRDFHIQPELVAQSMVPNEAPAFLVVDELVDKTPEITAEDFRAEAQSALKDLRCLFRSGRAWPTDINTLDQNLLHRAINMHGHSWSDSKSIIWAQFVKDLALMGVPLNQATRQRGSVLHWLLELRRRQRIEYTKQTSKDVLASGSFELAKALLEIGALSIDPMQNGRGMQGDSFASECKIQTLPDIYQSFSGYLNGFDYGALLSALLQRSELALRRILTTTPSSVVSERCHNGLTPLHVAAYWPRGLEILFELTGDACRQIIDFEDAIQLTAIHSAVLLQQTESVKLFLDQGASIDLENSATFFGHPHTSDAFYQSQEMINLLCGHLAARRREMLLFARRHLTVKELSDLGTTQQTMLQANAFEVVQALSASNINVPSTFRKVRPGSIYHSPVMNSDLAEGLYRSGFEGFDSVFNGCTPLATMRIFGDCFSKYPNDLLDSIAWFEGHGVSTKHVMPVFYLGSNETITPASSSPTTLHRLALALGQINKVVWAVRSRQLGVHRTRNRSLLRQILSDTSRDSCNCYCSRGGCSPASTYAAAWRMYDGYVRYNWMMFNMWHMISTTLDASYREDWQALLDFVRVITFDDLGMNYTCCKYRFDIRKRASVITNVYDQIWMMDAKEVAEIQEEDRYLADTLERLMDDFSIIFNGPNLDVGKFWKYWRTQVEEVEETKEEMTCEDIRAIREIGVNLE